MRKLCKNVKPFLIYESTRFMTVLFAALSTMAWTLSKLPSPRRLMSFSWHLRTKRIFRHAFSQLLSAKKCILRLLCTCCELNVQDISYRSDFKVYYLSVWSWRELKEMCKLVYPRLPIRDVRERYLRCTLLPPFSQMQTLKQKCK